MKKQFWLLPLCLLFLGMAAPMARAQKAAPATQSQTFQRMVEPSFRVQPIVHRFEGARGEVIPFAYNIESSGREMNVEVDLICLRQEESGLILFDDKRNAPKAVRMLTPRKFTISAGKSFDVKCEVTIPQERANFHSFGLLIRDLGQDTKLQPKFDPEGKQITQAGVKFITQYVLRCDIDVTNGNADKLNNVIIETGQVQSHNGLPVAKVYVSNPTDSAYEFTVRGSFPNLVGEQDKPFQLGMPSRSSLDGAEKYLIRLMPHSRVRLEAPVPQMLLPGTHDFEVELSSRTRKVTTTTFAVNVSPGDFPAQEVQVTRAGDSISVAPAQIELSQLRGGKRSVPLKFSNLSDSTQTVRLGAITLDGEVLETLNLQTKEFTLAPGASRRILATLRSRPNQKDPLFGQLKVETRTGDGEFRVSSVPLTMLYAPWGESQVEFSEPKWNDGDKPTVVVTATNKGNGYQPVDAGLVVADENGRSMQLAAGYGRWLRPGESVDLEFRLGGPLPPGLYQLRMSLTTTPGTAPITSSTNIRIGEEPAKSEKTAAADSPAANPINPKQPGSQKDSETPSDKDSTTDLKTPVTVNDQKSTSAKLPVKSARRSPSSNTQN